MHTLAATSRRYRFESRSTLVEDDLANIDFVGLE